MTNLDQPPPISSTDLQHCQEILAKIDRSIDHPFYDSANFRNLRALIHRVSKNDKKRKRKRLQTARNEQKAADSRAKNRCLLRAGRAQKIEQLQLENVLVPDGPVTTSSTSTSTSSPGRLVNPSRCYVCHASYRTLHFFYDRLCPSCAKLNFDKRNQTADLSNRVALVTGGRVKIGYRVVLKLLRAQCFVIVTSRFPMDCLNRLKMEEDFSQWKDRLHIYGVDFRYSKLVEHFASTIIEKYSRLDFLINNACQTIQRTADYYQHLFEGERLAHYASLSIEEQKILEGNLQFYQQFSPSITFSPRLALPTSSTSSSLLLDVNQQPIDFNATNSWRLRLADLSAQEINDVLTINTLAPFILNSQLKVLMDAKHPDPSSVKFIVNVSAMEGSFSRPRKTDRHPHTNAAKAALNMMTRTSAKDYRKSNIYMVSVDTGWINEENPLDIAQRKLNNYDFQTPLDEEDAAARILDPIFSTYQKLSQGQTDDLNIPSGCFLKDYRVCDW